MTSIPNYPSRDVNKDYYYNGKYTQANKAYGSWLLRWHSEEQAKKYKTEHLTWDNLWNKIKEFPSLHAQCPTKKKLEEKDYSIMIYCKSEEDKDNKKIFILNTLNYFPVDGYLRFLDPNNKCSFTHVDISKYLSESETITESQPEDEFINESPLLNICTPKFEFENKQEIKVMEEKQNIDTNQRKRPRLHENDFEESETDVEDNDTNSKKPINLKVYSLNLQNMDKTSRLALLLKDIQKENPDVIMFQEITQITWQYLYKPLTHHYNSYSPMPSQKGYGLCTFFKPKLEFVRYEIHIPEVPFAEKFGEQARPMETLHINDKLNRSLKLVNLHLQAINQDCNHYVLMELRRNQEKVNFIFIGDFNIRNDYNMDLYKHEEDAWIATGKKKDQFATYDPSSNSHAKKNIGKYQKSRLDRMLYNNNFLHCFDFHLAAKTRTSDDENISDHYAIVAQF